MSRSTLEDKIRATAADRDEWFDRWREASLKHLAEQRLADTLAVALHRAAAEDPVVAAALAAYKEARRG